MELNGSLGSDSPLDGIRGRVRAGSVSSINKHIFLLVNESRLENAVMQERMEVRMVEKGMPVILNVSIIDNKYFCFRAFESAVSRVSRGCIATCVAFAMS